MGDGGLRRCVTRYRIDLRYDGAEFSGWARQPGRRTVQQAVEDALTTLVREPAALTVAGRTDAGVHAVGQVAHVDLIEAVDPDHLLNRLNRLLPPDIRIAAVQAAPDGFDARFSALRRHYRYRVCDNPAGVDPLRRFDILAWPRHVDEVRMNEAAAQLLGEHDFVAFCRRREGATTVRELQRMQWTRDGDVLEASVVADAFCHSMVRSLVGAMLAVGEGRRDADWMRGLLSAPGRSSEIGVVAAHGLTLVQVDYPPDDELAERAEQSRRVRTLGWPGP